MTAYSYQDAAHFHHATKVKIKQLIEDAWDKQSEYLDAEPYGDNERINRSYWSGFENGLRRALRVIDGNG